MANNDKSIEKGNAVMEMKKNLNQRIFLAIADIMMIVLAAFVSYGMLSWAKAETFSFSIALL